MKHEQASDTGPVKMTEAERLQVIGNKLWLHQAAKHASDFPKNDVLKFNPDEYPDQLLTHYKSVWDISPEIMTQEQRMKMLESLLRDSFKSDDKFEEFLATFQEPFEYDSSGSYRSLIEVLAEDYFDKGESVAILMAHPEDLTDLPRFAGGLQLALFRKYGPKYSDKIGMVLNNSLAFETYDGKPVSTVVGFTAERYWTVPQTESTEQARLEVNILQFLENAQIALDRAIEESNDEFIVGAEGEISEQDLRDLSIYANRGAFVALKHDVLGNKAVKPEAGRTVLVTPYGSRADRKPAKNGRPARMTLKNITEGSSKLVGLFHAAMPAAIVGDRIKVGPIVRLEKPEASANGNSKAKKAAAYENDQQNVEDVMDVVAFLLAQIIEGPIEIDQDRTTKPGIMAEKLNSIISGIGHRATKYAST
jgi:hypothetical protein